MTETAPAVPLDLDSLREHIQTQVTRISEESRLRERALETMIIEKSDRYADQVASVSARFESLRKDIEERLTRSDPTELTTKAVSEATGRSRDEMLSLRAIIETRLDGIDDDRGHLWESVHSWPGQLDTTLEQRRREFLGDLAAAREFIEQRITGLESIMKILESVLKELPVERESLRERLQADIGIAVDNLQRLHEERFTAVQQQFTERDVRGEQEKKSSKEALDAALLAQKESVSQQNDANTTAATKTETNFTKQIDLVGTQITALDKSLTDRISELKERIDRGEGQDKGAAGQQGESRLNLAAVIQLLAFLVVTAGVLFAVLHH